MRKSRLTNPWLEVWFKHVCSNHLAAGTVTSHIGTLLTKVPDTLVDQCLPPSDKTLNPLEFHGKSRETVD